MKLGMLSHLVLKLVVGAFMILHSFSMLWSYDAFLKGLRNSILGDSFLNHEFFLLAMSLVPFLEFTIGLMILVGIYYRYAVVICAVLLLFHLVKGLSSSTITDQIFTTLTFVISLWLVYILCTKQDSKDHQFKPL